MPTTPDNKQLNPGQKIIAHGLALTVRARKLTPISLSAEYEARVLSGREPRPPHQVTYSASDDHGKWYTVWPYEIRRVVLPIVAPGIIHTPEEITYTPFVTEDSVGYEVRHVDGHTERIYLAPSGSTDEGPGAGNVFLYLDDEAITHVAFDNHHPERFTK